MWRRKCREHSISEGAATSITVMMNITTSIVAQGTDAAIEGNITWSINASTHAPAVPPPRGKTELPKCHKYSVENDTTTGLAIMTHIIMSIIASDRALTFSLPCHRKELLVRQRSAAWSGAATGIAIMTSITGITTATMMNSTMYIVAPGSAPAVPPSRSRGRTLARHRCATWSDAATDIAITTSITADLIIIISAGCIASDGGPAVPPQCRRRMPLTDYEEVIRSDIGTGIAITLNIVTSSIVAKRAPVSPLPVYKKRPSTPYMSAIWGGAASSKSGRPTPPANQGAAGSKNSRGLHSDLGGERRRARTIWADARRLKIGLKGQATIGF